LPLSDKQISERLRAALDVLGTEPGETLRGNTAIEVVRSITATVSVQHTLAVETGADQVDIFRKS